jgi:hypothetical protein
MLSLSFSLSLTVSLASLTLSLALSLARVLTFLRARLLPALRYARFGAGAITGRRSPCKSVSVCLVLWFAVRVCLASFVFFYSVAWFVRPLSLLSVFGSLYVILSFCAHTFAYFVAKQCIMNTLSRIDIARLCVSVVL